LAGLSNRYKIGCVTAYVGLVSIYGRCAKHEHIEKTLRIFIVPLPKTACCGNMYEKSVAFDVSSSSIATRLVVSTWSLALEER